MQYSFLKYQLTFEGSFEDPIAPKCHVIIRSILTCIFVQLLVYQIYLLNFVNRSVPFKSATQGATVILHTYTRMYIYTPQLQVPIPVDYKIEHPDPQCTNATSPFPATISQLRGAGTGPAGPAVAGPMSTPSLRHDDVLLALTIQYYTSAAVTGHLSNWILPLSVLLRVKLVWPARLLHVDRAFVEAPPIIERDPQSRISHVTLSMRTNERVLGDWYFTSGDYFGCLS